jgi:hypothetical protein
MYISSISRRIRVVADGTDPSAEAVVVVVVVGAMNGFGSLRITGARNSSEATFDTGVVSGGVSRNIVAREPEARELAVGAVGVLGVLDEEVVVVMLADASFDCGGGAGELAAR